jgi:hypothetical protein
MNRTDDVDDERGTCVGSYRHGHRSRLARRPRAEQVSRSEHEDDGQKDCAGDESPARRGEGVQHVVNCDNECLTRGWRNCVETVSTSDVTKRSAAAYREM